MGKGTSSFPSCILTVVWFSCCCVFFFFFFDCLFWFHRCQRRPNEAAKPKTDRCLPLPFSWHHGGLPQSGSDHPGASVENSKPGFFPPRGTCTGRSGCWPLPMAGALSSSLSSKATSSRTPSLATMLKGVALPHPGEPPSHTGPSVHGCWPTSPPLLFADGLSACCDRSPPTGWQPAARWGWDLVRGLGDPLAQHAAQRVGGKQAGPKWVEEGGLEKCLDPGTSVSTPGPR